MPARSLPIIFSATSGASVATVATSNPSSDRLPWLRRSLWQRAQFFCTTSVSASSESRSASGRTCANRGSGADVPRRRTAASAPGSLALTRT